MYIVLMGRPGSGKGTQSKRLIDWLAIPHLSTGEMLRAASVQDTPLGHKVAACIAGGNLASDELIMELVAERIARDDHARGCLFDGVPRTVAQARTLDELLEQQGAMIRLAVEMHAVGEELVQRILKRAETEGRADDTPETIQRRMEIYELETAPILDYYRNQGKLCQVDAIGTLDAVFARIKACVEKHAPTKKNSW